jgi:hypothetical protein
MTACVCSGRQNLQKKGMQRFGNSQGLIIITIIVWQANLQKKSDLIIYIIRMLQKKRFYGTTYNSNLTGRDANAKTPTKCTIRMLPSMSDCLAKGDYSLKLFNSFQQHTSSYRGIGYIVQNWMCRVAMMDGNGIKVKPVISLCISRF